MVRDYIDHAQAAGQRPDPALVNPIIAKLNALSES